MQAWLLIQSQRALIIAKQNRCPNRNQFLSLKSRNITVQEKYYLSKVCVIKRAYIVPQIFLEFCEIFISLSRDTLSVLYCFETLLTNICTVFICPFEKGNLGKTIISHFFPEDQLHNCGQSYIIVCDWIPQSKIFYITK